MRNARGLVTLLALLAFAPAAAAQGILLGPPDPGPGFGIVVGHGHKQFSLSLSGGFNRGYPTPFPYGRTTSITIVNVMPSPPPVIVFQPAPAPLDALFDLFPEARLPPALPPLLERPLPGEAAGRFRPLELYGATVADYPDHLRRLEEALARQPDDPVLLFLYAYELWFDGRKDEARPLFEKAAALMPDRSAADLFLKVGPGKPVVVR